MKSVVKMGLPALILFAATPATAGTIAGCIAANEDRDGIVSFDDYAVAHANAASVEVPPSARPRKPSCASRNREPGRIVCQTHDGAGHYVVVAGGVEYNGEVAPVDRLWLWEHARRSAGPQR